MMGSKNTRIDRNVREKLGYQLQKRREQLGLTQLYIANQLGVEYYTFISQIEGGTTGMPSSKIESYAELLGLEPYELGVVVLAANDEHLYKSIYGDDSEWKICLNQIQKRSLAS